MTRFPEIGATFGSWKTEGVPERRGKYYYVVCRCACGQQKEVRLDSLLSGGTKRCRHRTPLQPGDRFGSWEVVREAAERGHNRYFLCRCNGCGQEREVGISSLKYGESLSCNRCKGVKHGAARDGGRFSEHVAWQGMKQRCNNPKLKNYKNYGGRGISYDPRWESFEAFIVDMGLKPEAHLSLERKDNDGNYTKENCIWATSVVQMNNRRACMMLEWNGKRQSVAEWVRETGICRGVILYRLSMGWPLEEVLSPVRKKGGRLTQEAHVARMQVLRPISREARKQLAPGPGVTRKEWEAIKAAHDFRCVYCGKRCERLTQDHVLSLKKGGADTPENVVPACRSCNARKGARDYPSPVSVSTVPFTLER